MLWTRAPRQDRRDVALEHGEVKADPVLTSTQDNSNCNTFKGKTGRRLQQDIGEKTTQEDDAFLDGAPKGIQNAET